MSLLNLFKKKHQPELLFDMYEVADHEIIELLHLGKEISDELDFDMFLKGVPIHDDDKKEIKLVEKNNKHRHSEHTRMHEKIHELITKFKFLEGNFANLEYEFKEKFHELETKLQEEYGRTLTKHERHEFHHLIHNIKHGEHMTHHIVSKFYGVESVMANNSTDALNMVDEIKHFLNTHFKYDLAALHKKLHFIIEIQKDLDENHNENRNDQSKKRAS